MVLVRQRPATALGIIFITLEDETGHRQPRRPPQDLRAPSPAAAPLSSSRAASTDADDVVHLIVDRFESLAAGMRGGSRDFR